MNPVSTIAPTPVTFDLIRALAPFGLFPSPDPRRVFHSELNARADEIRSLYRTLPYDHRPEAPEWDRQFPYLMSEQFRVGYACFKYAVSKVIQPRTICEIGVGAGTGARAFLAASPQAHYIGIDDGSKDRGDSVHLIDYTQELLTSRGYSHEIRIADSTTLLNAPKADLFHVDGNHSFANAASDTRLALESGSPWILIDDSRDPVVCAGAFSAIANHHAAQYDWAYFEDTWTGNILLWKKTL